ncbi:MAG: glycosyltransferase [Solirubrobacteraceae bacterium]
MPRVLMAVEPPDGGVAEYVVTLARRLSDHGIDVEVAGPATGPILDRVAAAGVPVHRTALRRDYSRPGADARALRELTRIARGGRFDLVHCHSAKAGVLGRIAARAAGLPAVYSPHGFPFVGDVSRKRRVFGLTAERALSHLTARILCVCEYERSVALGHRVAPAARLQVVLNGTERCDQGLEPDRALAALRTGGVVAAAVSALRPGKGLEALIQAAPAVLARLPDARIALVGDGPLRDELGALAERLGLDAEERFAFLPYRGPSSRHLRACDVYVLASSSEALSLGVLEALACGVPQVVTRVGGLPEAVDADTGILVALRDATELTDAIVALLGDDERRARLAVASRARHAARFSLDRMVGETAALYRDVLSGT